MANVYLAEDAELGRRVAIKILNERYANDDLFVERFRREAKSAAGLSHPNIVSIYDRGEAEGTYYIAMEVIDGAQPEGADPDERSPRPAQAIAYARQILSALRFAHRNGIVHRDIKPHNILIGPEERLKVTDFGIARAGASQMTEAGSIMGTAQYLSPEQARGGEVEPPPDLYSVGVVLYEMLTGEVPFSGDSPVEIAMKHVNDPPRPPSARAPGIPADLDRIVMRALAKNPADRYRTAEEMDSDLARIEAGLPIARETADAATADARRHDRRHGCDAGAPAPSGAAGRQTAAAVRSLLGSEAAETLVSAVARRGPAAGRVRGRGVLRVPADRRAAPGIGARRGPQRRGRRPVTCGGAARGRGLRGRRRAATEQRGREEHRHRPGSGARGAGREGRARS